MAPKGYPVPRTLPELCVPFPWLFLREDVDVPHCWSLLCIHTSLPTSLLMLGTHFATAYLSVSLSRPYGLSGWVRVSALPHRDSGCSHGAWHPAGLHAVPWLHPLNAVWSPQCGHLPYNDHIVWALLPAPQHGCLVLCFLSICHISCFSLMEILSEPTWDRYILLGRDYGNEEQKARPWRGECDGFSPVSASCWEARKNQRIRDGPSTSFWKCQGITQKPLWVCILKVLHYTIDSNDLKFHKKWYDLSTWWNSLKKEMLQQRAVL